MNWLEYDKHLIFAGIKPEERNFLKDIFDFAKKIHEGERRVSGEEYIIHPITVSLKLLELKLDTTSIAAGLLHDVVERDANALKVIQKKFGEELAFLVGAVTKVDKVRAHGVERTLESIRKMFLAVAQDIRVVMVKLMDRLHNMETLSWLPREKQERIARETLSLYAPLAERLGMWNLKAKLEDLSMRYIYPKEYYKIAEEIKIRVPERERYLKKIIPLVDTELKKENVAPKEISYRAKHLYSAWQKLERHEGDWKHIMDLVAARIIVKDIKDCYATVGILHKLWKPVPGEFMDYVALPKPNGYQSLHTRVFAERGVIVEFQIRTVEMHQEAEFGIAAHWAYSELGKPKFSKFKTIGKKFNWVGQLQKWQKELEKSRPSSEELLESLKIDFFKDRIFVLTPKGDVIDLPQGATPLDFAYHIHSEIGNRAAGAKINGKLVSFSRELLSGEIVEVITQKQKKPSKEWLSIVKTGLAKNRIRKALKLSPGDSFLTILEKPVEIQIYGRNRVGFIKDITNVFARYRINLQTLSAERSGSEAAPIRLAFVPKNKTEVDKIIKHLEKISGVLKIQSKAKTA
jgi:GTP diphosphokinase / guanosine-3',5'-bis(diphosphate) 3'-diphosphatase